MNSARPGCRNRGGLSKLVVPVLGGLIAVLLICAPAFSQGNFGRILGTVTDQSGGVVAGATVTVLDVDRGTSRVMTTDDAGAYNAPSLNPGNYTVRVEAKGFKRIERQGVVIEVGHEVRVDLTVQPGEQNQTVTVTEAVPLVETTNATMGGTLENADIIDLPLNGRDYQNLLGLRPGVMLQPGGGPWTQSTNGVRPDESVWLVEGIININFFDARPVINMPSPFTDGATILPVDAIQEFNLQENPKAEYGWKAGAIVNVGIKSGTNTLHGDAYAFGRYQNWDARNYFNISNPAGCPPTLLQSDGTCPQTPAQLKQFGGVVGGPIKKDKLFFFGGYEGLRSFIGFVGGIAVPATAALTVPTTGVNCPASVTGDCAGSMINALQALNAAGITPSPVSLKVSGCTAGATPVCTGAAGNGAQLFPNLGTGTTFVSTFPTTNTTDNGVGKLDYHPNDKNSINGMFFYGKYNALGEDHPFVSQPATDLAPITSMTITSSWVYTVNTNVVNEARFGYDRASFQFVNIDNGVSPTAYGFTSTGVTNKLVGGLPSVTIAGFGNGGTPLIGTAFNRPQYFTPNPYWDVQDSISVLKGKHSIKFGGEFAHTEADAQVFNNGRGRFDFNGLATNSAALCPTGAVAPCSTPLEDFFAGNLSDAVLLTGTPLSKLTAYDYAGFLQDDWRMTPRLIVNLGIRYNVYTPLKDASNNLGNFDPASPTGMVQQGQNGYGTVYKIDPYNFEPRFGLAWDMRGNGTTVLRLGVGLIHETWNLETFEGQFGMQGDGSTALNAIPTAATITCGLAINNCPSSGGGTNSLGSATFQPGVLCWDSSLPSCPAMQATIFPGAGGGPTCGDGVKGAASPCDLMAVDPNIRVPFVVNYNLGITHAFTPNISLEVEYVGNHGYRLLSFADINQAQLGSKYCLNPLTAAQKLDACNAAISPNPDAGLAEQESRPYYSKFPYLGYIYQATNRAYSNYNSLQATLTQRMTHGLSYTVGYTYAHGLDNGSLNRFGLNPENSNNIAGEYGSSDFDVRHRLTATVTYNIPGIKGFGQLLEGWQINTIVNYATAQPWNVFDNSDDLSGTGEKTDRWDIFGNPSDFNSGKNSFAACGGYKTASPSCSITNVYGTFPAGSGINPAACTNAAGSNAGLVASLDAIGCYISPNGASVLLPPAKGTFGNMGRNIFRDQGFKDWDVSLFKNFTFKERYGIQARWEVFNVLNHPIAANPYGASSFVNSGNGLGGSPLAAAGASLLTPDFAAGNPLIGSGSQRVMQIGLKISF